MDRQGFCIYVNTAIDGPVPVERNESGNPVVYSTLHEAQRVIADDAVERLHQFIEGEREFDDAMTIEEYIVEVGVLPDGAVSDEEGNYFGGNNW